MITIIHYKREDRAILRRIRNNILSRVSERALIRQFPLLVRQSIDFVLDHEFTGRTDFADLDNVEKTFIGLKLEHRLRHLLGVPKGKHDLVIGRTDVDVKNTIGASWMIGPEIYRDEAPCVLTQIDDENRLCSLGVIVARKAYLGAENRDRKRSILKSAFDNIPWIIDDAIYPETMFVK